MERDRTKTENKLLRQTISAYFEHSFLICTVVMVLACSFMSMAIDGFASFVRKQPWPLKNSLDLLDEEALLPYKVVSKSKITNPRIVQELGTKEYIEWILEDTNSSSESPVRFCSLFITYYSMPDRVPHVPDECYVGVGYQRLTGKNIQVSVGLDDTIKNLPVRYVIFSGSGESHWSSKKFQVLYLFRVNDQYCGNRESARIALDKNIFRNHSYFSKVEWKFFNKRFGLETYPEIDEAMGASEKFLGVVLPILEKDHWNSITNAKKSNE
ncbi:MAG: hypothetical protein ACYSSP_00250 [Planctomycetota bacterium]|jgi:hypothetical protein